MDFQPVPFDSELAAYLRQAEALLAGHAAGDPGAIDIFHRRLPRFLDPNIVWLPKEIPDSEIQSARLDLADAQLVIARCYSFQDWAALESYVTAVNKPGSTVFLFESAVEAVIAGDTAELERLIATKPELVREQSTRVCCFDPPRHRATLLHYVAANGVEGYREKTPKEVVDVARVLLRAGADPDALADMYGGQCTPMSMLVSSSPPAAVGLQVDLIDTLVDFGASVEPRGAGNWQSPLRTALVFGFIHAAQALVRRGAKVDNIAVAAGLGRVDDTARLLPHADAKSRHLAMAMAAQLGHVEVVRLLLDAGEDPNRYNPEGSHKHSTPLHQAAAAGHLEVIQVLLERGARPDIKDTIWNATPLGWAVHNHQPEVADYLRTISPR